MKISTGNIIFALRKSKGLTQEQLSEQMQVSAVAVSKWENGISLPDVSMFCKLADFFDVSVDDLLGRKTKPTEHFREQQEERQTLLIVEDLLMICELSRKKGLLAIEAERKNLKSQEPFLIFSCNFALSACREPYGTPERIGSLLLKYAESEAYNKNYSRQKHLYLVMIAEVIPAIFAGEVPGYVNELIASFLGRGMRKQIISAGKNDFDTELSERLEHQTEVLLEQIAVKSAYSERTNLLSELAEENDEILQLLIRQINNQELIHILVGSDGKVAKRLLSNLSKQLAFFIYEDMEYWNGTENDIIYAECHVLEFYHAIKNGN